MSLDRQEIYRKVSDIIAERLHVEKSQLTPEATFDSLGADSLSRVEIMLDVEDAFGIQITDEDAERIETMSDVVDYISSQQDS